MSIDLYRARLKNLLIPADQKEILAKIKHYKDSLVRIKIKEDNEGLEDIDKMERGLATSMIAGQLEKLNPKYIPLIDQEIYTGQN
jgi:hypothetical protein